jgi:hypothetical protein
MALTTRNAQKGIVYLQIADYSICEKYAKEQNGDDWEVLHTKDREGNDYTSWIRRYKNVDGLITNIEFITKTLPGKNIPVSSWKISLFDDVLNERYVLTIPATSPAASRFIKLAENIDPEQPVEFSAWRDNSSQDGPKLAFMVKQNGANIPQRYTIKDGALVDYTKENWEDAPKVKVLRNKTKDWTEVEEFLFERMETIVIPKFQKNEEKIRAASETQYEEDVDDVESADEKIPF